jgi:hypothetical protein
MLFSRMQSGGQAKGHSGTETYLCYNLLIV